LARATHNDVLSVGVRPKMRPVGVAKRTKKTETFMRQVTIHASNWLGSQFDA